MTSEQTSPPGAEALQLQPGELVAGRYEVVEEVGAGLLGRTYRVRNTRQQGEVVALKILSPRLTAADVDVARLNRQLAVARRLDHPGIARIYDSGEYKGARFFTSEFVEGQTLRARLDERRAAQEDTPPPEVYAITVQLLEILRYAHRVTVHRDLKPENILVFEQDGPDGRARLRLKVTDFAITQVMNPTIFASSYVDRGTASYTSPEVHQYQDRVGPAADLYSVGAIFYELLTGDPPKGRYLLPSEARKDLSARIDSLVEIALAPNPQDRFQSADDFLSSLKITFADLYAGEGATLRTVVRVLLGLILLLSLVTAWLASDRGPSEEELYSQEVHRRGALRQQLISQAGAEEAPGLSPEDMVWIPSGPFLGGRFRNFDPDAAPSEPIEERLEIDGFWIDRYPFPGEEGAEPLTEKTVNEARAYCERRGRRLCQHHEWLKACRGPSNLIYAYSDRFEEHVCARSREDEHRIGDNRTCVSGYGVYEMGAAAAEWTETEEDGRRIVPGVLSPGQEQSDERCAAYTTLESTFYSPRVAFRCCVSPGELQGVD